MCFGKFCFLLMLFMSWHKKGVYDLSIQTLRDFSLSFLFLLILLLCAKFAVELYCVTLVLFVKLDNLCLCLIVSALMLFDNYIS